MSQRTAVYNYGNDVVLPTAANVLVPDRPHGRKSIWVKNQGANVMLIAAPSGSVYRLDPGATWFPPYVAIQDGAYTITGTAAQTFSFEEVY